MTYDEKVRRIGDIYRKVVEQYREYTGLWYRETLFHWDWWVALAMAVLPWVIWIKVRPKQSSGRLLLAGFAIVIVTSWFDFLGVQFGLWYYTAKIIPTIPTYIPWDFCIFPVLAMLLLQWRPTLHPLWKAALYASANSLIGEPLAKWAKFYVELHWSVWYSLPIHALIYLMAYKLSCCKSFEPLPKSD